MRESEQLSPRPEHVRGTIHVPGRREGNGAAHAASPRASQEQDHAGVLAERARCAGIAEAWQNSARLKSEFAGITNRELLVCSELAAAIAHEICDSPAGT